MDRTLTCPTTRGRISSPRAALTIITLVTGAVQHKIKRQRVTNVTILEMNKNITMLCYTAKQN